MSIDLPILDNSVCRRSYGAREMRSRLCAGFLFSYDEGGICPVRMNGRLISKYYRNACKGAQWLSGRVLDSRPGSSGSSLTGVTALWSLNKTHLS